MDRIVREAVEIAFLPYNMNREAGYCLRNSQKPLICSLKKCLNMTPNPLGYTSHILSTALARPEMIEITISKAYNSINR
jgi:hypothetical protein